MCLISSNHVSSQVNTQDSDSSQRQGDINDDEQQERSDLWDVAGQSVGNGLFQIIKDQTAWRITKRRVTLCAWFMSTLLQMMLDDVIFCSSFSHLLLLL